MTIFSKCCSPLFFLLVIVSSFILPLQAKTPDKAANLLELAKKQKMRLATDSAYLSYSQAAALFKGKDAAQYTRARLELVSVLLEMKAYNNARHNLKQDLVFIQRNFKPVSNEMWQYYLLLGELQFQQKEIENTFGSWHRARNIAEQLHGTESMQAATAYYYLGKHLLFGGSTDSSWHYANKAIANLNRHPQPWKIEKASAIYNLVGSHFRISHYGQMHSPIKTVVYNGKKYPNAAAVYLAFLDSALIAETYNAGPNGGNSGKVYYNMATAYGDIFQQTNPANQAERKELARKMNFYLDKAEPLLLKNKDPEIAMLYNFRGGQYGVSDYYDFEKASYYYLKALKICLPGHKGRSLYEMPVISNVQSENNLGLTLDYISYLLMDRYEGEKDMKDLEAVYQYAIKKIELAEYSQDQKQVAYNGQSGPSLIYNNQPYGQAIEMAHKLYEKTGNRKYLEEAFEIAEKFKNFNLVQASLKTRIAQYLKGHKKLADEYNLLKRKLKTLEERQVMARRYPLLRRHVPFTSAGSELARTQTRMKEFEDLVKGDFPQFYQEKIKRNYALTLNEARQQLPDDKTAILSYFVNEDFMDFSKQAFVFVIQKNSAHFIKMPLPEDYEDHIKSMVLGITTSDLPLYRGHASQLYNLLVKPVQPKLEKQVNNLVVMPDGYLWQIPFETLLNQATASLDYRKLPYLFRNYNISYQHSATLSKVFKDQAASQSGNHTELLLAMAPFADKKLAGAIATGEINLMSGGLSEETYAKLPYTIGLLNDLKHQVKGMFLIDQEASEANFKQNASRFSVIHLATHAETNFMNPLQSKFLMAQGNNEDGSLYMSELLNMNIRPNLAVLSACETGVGRMEADNEGMASLSWCFNYLGCPSTLSTLWKVDDRQTSNLLKGFYGYLFSGETKKVALQQAKLDFIQNARTSDEANPFYWSGMVLTGDDGYLALTSRPFWQQWEFWAGTGLITIMGLSFLLVNMRRKNKNVSTGKTAQRYA